MREADAAEGRWQLPSSSLHIRHGDGHGVAVPDAQGRSAQVPPNFGRIRFAHSDWASYSVFEEAFTLGHLAGSSRGQYA